MKKQLRLQLYFPLGPELYVVVPWIGKSVNNKGLHEYLSV